MLDIIKEERPANLRPLLAEVPAVAWDQIGGYHETKASLQKVLKLGLQSELLAKFGVSAVKGILLYGPPGCSKTLFARAVASSSNYFFMAVKGPELFSKYVGDSQKAIRQIFSRARACSPSVIFFDEIDAMGGQRNSSETDVSDRVLISLLTELDGLSQLKEVLVIAATNRPDILDKALLRPGRIDSLIYVGLPDLLARKEIISISLHKFQISEQ